ncbi:MULTISPECIES: DUF4345 domain-containing protein [Hyphomonas]|uniref:DUF4345 domain-containing protein n=1 Tax=Hyphomonas adhaerens TaxID=81029 RepID=A0A3B9GY71_9PROT|nr:MULTISPECIES: DUF4345 domain-containing protein [Hyphomonas]MBB39802.1 hypothetical protein [Hyphomonas sp.]HAE27380.1 hypothetical protein [Hyphomonas adhaerens]|tara:strand:- start:168 stop:587 length:420 start_codon:yes stop_codon:yes gene_type:complete
MSRSKIQSATLFVSGLIAVLIGAAIVLDPVGFHATSGIQLGAADPALLNEMRAAGGPILAVGLLALTGLFLRRLQMLALTASAVFYTGYGVARLASLMVDGVPDQAMVWITLLELVIGAACFAAIAMFPTSRRPDVAAA